MKKRFYPPAEGQTNPQQQPLNTQTSPVQQPLNTANAQPTNTNYQTSPFAQPFGQQNVAPVPTYQTQQTGFPQPANNGPFAAPVSNAYPPTSGFQPADNTYGQPQRSASAELGPPPTGLSQGNQPQIVTKHKHVFAVDPESSYASGFDQQLAQGMSQMNLGGQTPGQQQQPGAPAPVVQEAYDPLSVNQSSQTNPLYMRMSINSVPDSGNLLNKSNLPFGCVIHPLAEATNPDDKIPVVNFGMSGIVRCRRCRAYINPFVTFVDGGRRWRCNLCGLPNDVPGDYFCALDRNGRRNDINERPELLRGAVEFIASSEYMVRPPQPPTYLFVIDVGYYSLTSGMFTTTIKSIQSIINNFQGDTRTRIGFITYDSSVHFYNLKSTLSSPQMLVVTDIDDVFLPLPDDMLVNLNESKAVVETLLSKFPSMFTNTQVVDSCLGVALKAAFNITKNTGGKLLLFANGLPTLSHGKLPNREDLKLLGTDKESNLLVADQTYYKDFALDCSRQQIAVDLFLFSSQFIDASNLGSLPQFTGGQLYYYPGFRSDRDGEKLFRDIARNITRETGWEGVMRVRTSKGIKVSAHYGNFFIRSSDLLALPSIDADKAFAVQFSHSDNNIGTKFASFQAALLYTTSGGERRIRVFTMCLPVTTILADLYKYADVEATTSLLAKMAIEKALSSRLSDARDALINKCIDILATYRSDVAPNAASSGQLMLPETLKLLPLYTLALIKNIILRMGTDIRPDERTYFLSLARVLPSGLLLNFIYPRLFALHTMPEEAGLPDATGSIVLPPTVNLSSEKLDRRGVFLLEDGDLMYLWIGREVSPDLLVALLGIPSLEGYDTSLIPLPAIENPYNVRVNNIVNAVRAQRPSFMSLHLVREGEPREIKFFSHLIEDKTKSVHSYYEFLVNLHQRVQAKVSKR